MIENFRPIAISAILFFPLGDQISWNPGWNTIFTWKLDFYDSRSMGVNNGWSSIETAPRRPMASSLSSSMGASHSNASSFARRRDPLTYWALPRHHGKGGIFLQRWTLHRREFPKRNITSPVKITPRPPISESFSGVEPGIKGNAKTMLPMGTMTVDAMTSTLADPNLDTWNEAAIIWANKKRT